MYGVERTFEANLTSLSWQYSAQQAKRVSKKLKWLQEGESTRRIVCKMLRESRI